MAAQLRHVSRYAAAALRLLLPRGSVEHTSRAAQRVQGCVGGSYQVFR